MNERTHRITFDPAALTDDQRDGFTCVVCSADLATGGPSVPVGTVPGGLEFLGGQVFACTSHTAGDEDDEPRTHDVGDALRDVATALRAVADALESGQDVDDALTAAEDALKRADAVLDARRGE